MIKLKKKVGKESVVNDETSNNQNEPIQHMNSDSDNTMKRLVLILILLIGAYAGLSMIQSLVGTMSP
jgi:hypothetical protein